MKITSSILFAIIFLIHPASAVDYKQELEQKFGEKLNIDKANHLVANTANFYRQNGFQPIWLDGGSGFKSSVKNMLNVLSKADQEGLDVKDYAKAQELVDAAKADPSLRLQAEIAITGYVLEYIDDLLGERLNPRKIGRELYLKAKSIDAVQIFKEGMEKDSDGDWLATLTVHHPQYQALKAELAKQREHLADAPFPMLSPGPSLELGDKGGRVETLQWQLTALGYLKGTHEKGSFDGPTQAALKHFQEENDLEVDGKCGPNTTAALNAFNREKRIEHIIISMERWRWLPEDMGDRYAMVNIAGFNLTAFAEGKEVLRMPVIIGRPYRKTPVFVSEITDVVFNPSWYVPYSIAVKDKIRKIARDPGYLSRGGFVVSDSAGNAVDPGDVDWGSLGPGNFPYRLRQRPGAGNALGKIKFNIHSPFGVYLHSTNEPQLFEKRVRTISSGCIRLQNPKALGEFVFNDPSKWTIDTIGENMEGTQTRNVKLTDPVKVYITYFTVWTDPEGKIVYSDDVYEQDRAIWSALQNRPTPSMI